jgi:hypothetical protein
LDIYAFLSSYYKILPKEERSILDEENVNTAYTSACPYNGSIVLYRKQEWFKVFIHESIHSFGIDFNINTNDSSNKEIVKIFKVNSQVNFYETYTEFWAEIMNVIFLSYEIVNEVGNEVGDSVSIKERKEENYIYTFNFLINNEIKFNMIQLVKILNYMGIKYEDLYTGNAKNTYKEKTNVLAYYILKLILLYHYNDFLNWCIENNKNIIKFDERNQNLFCDFIKKNYKNRNMIIEINNIHDLIYKNEEFQKLFIYHNENKNNKDFFYTTLRMTMYD